MTNTQFYEVNTKWNSLTNRILSAPKIANKTNDANSSEFPNGIKEKWTPEHLFVAAINSKLMATFLLVAENSKLHFRTFECNDKGKMEKVDGKLVVTEIVLKPSW